MCVPVRVCHTVAGTPCARDLAHDVALRIVRIRLFFRPRVIAPFGVFDAMRRDGHQRARISTGRLAELRQRIFACFDAVRARLVADPSRP